MATGHLSTTSFNMMKKFLVKLMIFAGLILLLDRGIAALLQRGLDRYYGLDKRAGVLCIGHSHTMLGIDGAKLEQGLGVPVAKYAVNGANAFDRLAMIRHYFAVRPDTVRLVVYDVDDHAFTGAGLSANSYRLLYPYLETPDIARHVRDNAGSWKEYAARRLLRLLRYNSVTLNLALRGTLRRYDNFKTGRVDIQALKNEISAGRRPPVTIEQEMVEVFAETVRFVRSHHARLVLFSIPTVDQVNNMNRERHEQVMEIFRRYAEQDPGVIFLDYNPTFSQHYELFCDPIHLNRDGQRQVTDKAIHDLHRLLQE